MRVALTRPVPESLARCELTHLERMAIDVARAAAQHDSYEAALRALGCAVATCRRRDALPDSVFVEDVAIVLDEVAVITRPGAASRRPEREAVAPSCPSTGRCRRIAAPGTLDGGDVLRLGRTLYVGLSTRTNEEGARQLAGTSHRSATRSSACRRPRMPASQVARSRTSSPIACCCNPAWIDARTVRRVDVVPIDPSEPFAANVLRIGDAIVCAAAHSRTAADLRRARLQRLRRGCLGTGQSGSRRDVLQSGRRRVVRHA